tara:strand:- start:2713 stop:3636 length:924 start_codon:yes stop_codon:yes gene_type:complete
MAETSASGSTTAVIGKSFWFSGKGLVAGIPYLWLFVFFLVPFAIVFRISLSEPMIAQPPYSPLFGADGSYQGSFFNYQLLFEDALFRAAYLNSLWVAGISTLVTLLIGYPMAYVIARARPLVRNLLLMAVMLPFWSSFLLRVYALKTIMADTGLVNGLLLNLGLIDAPIRMLQTDFALYVGISYTYLPFMILPLYATLERLDWSLVEAAEDLGCRSWKAFLLVTLPLSVPGMIAGAMLVFIPATGEFVIPNMLGASDTLMIGRMLWDTFFSERDWTLASSLAVVLLLLLVLPIMLFQIAESRREERA